jgi:hypothetical protein
VDTVVGDLLPRAVGVAISPIPIIAVILMLLAPRAGRASTGFGLGWLLGIVVVTTIVLLVASGAGTGTGEPSAVVSWTMLLLGVLLLGAAVRQWRARPKPGAATSLPKWMAAIDNVTPVRAAGLGFALSAVNPKNLLMCIAAGVTIGGASLAAGEAVAAVAVFTVVAASTVLVPWSPTRWPGTGCSGRSTG